MVKPRWRVREHLSRQSRAEAISSSREPRRLHQEGQGLVEYGLILVLVAIVVVMILATMGQEVKIAFSDIVNALTGSS
jgi:pilus assembly protein Flp/PilA